MASAFALATGGVGRLVAPQAVAVTVEHLPVVAVSTVGPDEVAAGATVDYDLALANLGSQGAGNVDLAATADGDPLSLVGAPTELVAGGLATATTSYTAPADGSDGSVDVRGEVTWTDSLGNLYGPTGSTAVVALPAPATLIGRLVDSLAVDADGNGLVSPGDTIRYELTVVNDGGADLTGVVASADLDPNAPLAVGSVITDTGVVTTGNGAGDTAVSVDVGTVPGGSTATIVFDAVVADPFPDGTSRVTATGEVSADGFDPVPTDDPALPGAADSTRTGIVVPRPALVAFLFGGLSVDADGSGTVTPGDTLAMTVSVDSIGTEDVTGVGVTVPMPDGLTLVPGSVTTSTGTVSPGTDVVVDVGALASFTMATIGFEVTVDDPFPPGVTEVELQATVTSNELDPITSDDPDTFEVGDGTVIAIGGSGGPSEIPGPEVGPILPEDGVIATEPVEISTVLTPVDGTTVESWTVSYRVPGDATLTELASGTGPTVSATLDPTALANGLYEVTIVGIGSDGGITVVTTSIVVDGQLKPGRYVTTFQDLAVGLGGFPIEINRTYDSFDKSVGDFGVGWTLDIADFQVASNGPLGDQGWIMETCGGGLIFSTLCFSSERPHYVTVTWPDGLTETFDLTPAEGSTFLTGQTAAEFAGRAGTTSTLEAIDSSIFWQNGNLHSGLFGTGPIYDPTRSG